MTVDEAFLHTPNLSIDSDGLGGYHYKLGLDIQISHIVEHYQPTYCGIHTQHLLLNVPIFSHSFSTLECLIKDLTQCWVGVDHHTKFFNVRTCQQHP